MDSMVEKIEEVCSKDELLLDNMDCVKHVVLLAEYFKENPKIMKVKVKSTGEQVRYRKFPLTSWYKHDDAGVWFSPLAIPNKYKLTPVVWANILHALSKTALVHVDISGITSSRECMQTLLQEVFEKRSTSSDMNTPLESNGKITLRAIGVQQSGGKQALVQGDIDFVLDATDEEIAGDRAEAEGLTEVSDDEGDEVSGDAD